ncbi:MAG TPA: hypothetical protein VFA18_15045, partial [Gemmataceae bacterium]|nr:hypothetical protein [Gemmataceae bacterium]
VRLEPAFCCYAPPHEAPPVAPLPAQRNGFITFGSLHKLEKLNNTVLDVWARILKALPSARLLVCRHVMTGRTAALMQERFVQRGVDPAQLVLKSTEPIALRHLRVYDDVDIALDPWPWNGHTTACEGLWMGVPVVALRGDRHASRMTASVLSCLGLNHWIADMTDEYVGRAIAWANRIPDLARLRADLRERVRQSPLCDAARFRRGLHQAYRQMWQRWCETAKRAEA